MEKKLKKEKKIKDKSWLKIIEEFEFESSYPWQLATRHKVMSDFVWFLIEKYGIPAKLNFPRQSQPKQKKQ